MILSLIERVREAFREGGVLSERIDNYEPRPQQCQMADAVAEAFLNSEPLLVEAGTGVGKSFAYLVPAIHWAKMYFKRVVVSTYTRTLQDQLVSKDLPSLRKALGFSFSYASLYGAENYLSLRRMNRALDHSRAGLFEQGIRDSLKELVDWSHTTRTGLRSELNPPPSLSIWMLARRDPNDCMGKECPYFPRCFYFRAKREAFNADILIVNHALFFANLATDWSIFPKPDAVIFDEAHTLEDVVAEAMGIRVSSPAARRLMVDIKHPTQKKGLIYRMPGVADQTKDEIISASDKARVELERFFQSLPNQFPWNEKSSFRIRKPPAFPPALSLSLGRLVVALRQAEEEAREDFLETSLEIHSLAERVDRLQKDLQNFLTLSSPHTVYWLERISGSRSQENLELRSAPLEVAEHLRHTLFSSGFPAVLTSATLTVNRSFSHLRQRLGLVNGKEAQYGSPFDYPTQALLYVARDILDPKEKPEEYEEKVNQRVLEILQHTNGATLILCTSIRVVKQLTERIKGKFPQMQIFSQGNRDPAQILSQFRQTPNAVLVGTTTFWQGVDVPGEGLICVVITRLPFEVPEDPLTEGRCEWIEECGGNPFQDYSLPNAVLLFRQGFGRLIRSHKDWGVVAVLDPRVTTKSYGEVFLNSLPNVRITSSMTDLSEFIRRHRKVGLSPKTPPQKVHYPAHTPLSEEEKRLFNALCHWRALEARKRNIPPYCILHNSHLAAIVKLKPTTEEDLLKIYGIRERKLKAYGSAILSLVAGHNLPK